VSGPAETPLRPPPRLTFPRSRRITHDLEFQAVYDARMKKARGPLAVFAIPNARPYSRLGLSVGRRVGGAVVRNGVKRALREAFRHIQHDLPVGTNGGYDLVVSVRPHPLAGPETYQAALADLAQQLHREWERRSKRRDDKELGA